mgnify:CR=1 FL=1
MHRAAPHLNRRGSRARSETAQAENALFNFWDGRLARFSFASVIPPVLPQDILRQSLRARRRALSAAEQQTAALAVTQRLADEPDFANVAAIAGYYACQGELDPALLLKHAWLADKKIYLPVLAGEALRFAPYQCDAPLRRNRFNIPEPQVSPTAWRQPFDMDWVLTPLTAFDVTGTRLGMGGGFYDRSFAFLLDPNWRGHRPRLIGLGYEFQRVNALIRQLWDVPLDMAITEKNRYVFASNGFK